MYVFTILCALALAPQHSFAQSADVQAEIELLMQQIAALQVELQNAASPTPTLSTPSSTRPAPLPTPTSSLQPPSCASIARVLSLGSSGRDVSALQKFLAADSAVYPEGIVSGYFGSLTETAVKRFQEKMGIASSGSPGTTGFGAVGPRTRARIAELSCATIPEIERGGAVPRCTIRTDRTTVLAGNPVTVSWNSTNASTAIDNTSGERVELMGTTVFRPKTDSTFTYSFFGYSVSLPAVCSVRVKIAAADSAPAAEPVVPSVSSSSAGGDTLTTTPSQGAAPLYVQFLFKAREGLACGARQLTIEYGDGGGAMLETSLCATLGMRSVYHLYAKTGAYTARVYDNSLCVGNLRCDMSVEVAKALVSVSGLSACSLGGLTVANGSARDFYSSPVALSGETCASRRLARLCLDGALSGDASYSYPSCKEATELSCTLDGVTVANGSSRTFYTASSIAAGNSCSSISLSRACVNGTLEGSTSYSKASCVVAAPTCTQGGITLAHGSSTTFYFAQNVPHGELCSSYGQTRTCESGTLSGSASYQYASCAPVSANSCALDNVVVTHGSSAPFYKYRTAPAGALCSGNVQTRTCDSGLLSGSSEYLYVSCTNQATCVLDGITLAHGSSTVFYKARTVPFGSTCSQSSQSRACTNGTLSGSSDYQYASCSVTAP